jgi:hypothetical protein
MPVPKSLQALTEDFSANVAANAKVLLRISRALDYEQLAAPDGMIAAVLNLAAETLERVKPCRKT